jgi:hypothetical protein
MIRIRNFTSHDELALYPVGSVMLQSGVLVPRDGAVPILVPQDECGAIRIRSNVDKPGVGTLALRGKRIRVRNFTVMVPEIPEDFSIKDINIVPAPVASALRYSGTVGVYVTDSKVFDPNTGERIGSFGLSITVW